MTESDKSLAYRNCTVTLALLMNGKRTGILSPIAQVLFNE